jgi:hypothetical protein
VRSAACRCGCGVLPMSEEATPMRGDDRERDLENGERLRQVLCMDSDLLISADDASGRQIVWP